MIVREQDGYFVLFKQFDHCQVSGIFASHWREKPEPYQSVHYAIENHDIGWEQLDHTIAWDEQTNKPYSFSNYPLIEKLSAYQYGLNLVENKDPYAGYLCSQHYASFFRNAQDKESLHFRKSEMERQQRLKQTFTEHQLNRLNENYNLLKICDDLSLFICLNEPGQNTHPWYQNGFKRNGGRITPVWTDHSTLTMSPNPFTRPFDISIPYQLVSRERKLLGQNRLNIQVQC